ncbi:MAG: DUF6252 family protein [Cyclobacteriaceae bacterium]
MNTSYLYRLAFLAIGLLFLISCNDDDPAPDPLSLLPPATQSGAESWGAIINGKAAYNYNRADYNYLELRSGKELTIYLGAEEDEFGSIAINIEDTSVIGLKTYALTNEYEISADYGGNNSVGCVFLWPEIIDGFVTITKFDPADERVIAGTFEFTSAKEGCDTLRVRNGRFDIITSY